MSCYYRTVLDLISNIVAIHLDMSSALMKDWVGYNMCSLIITI
jgi:hypothetical protein